MELLESFNQWKALQPLSEMDNVRLRNKFMLDFNYNSNHIEGNALTYGQTEVLLMFGEVMGNGKMKDFEEMKAHHLCLNLMMDEAQTDKPLTESFIRALHRVMLREDYEVSMRTPSGEVSSYTVHAGVYKTRPNSVRTPAGTMFYYATPEETPSLMYDLVRWYNEAAAEGTLLPIELASIFHYRYIRIHPFEDGNGRIARLMVNFILKRHGWPMMVIKTKNKQAYLRALAQADAAIGLVPGDGAHAEPEKIAPFINHMKAVLHSDIIDYTLFITGKNASWWFEGEMIKFSTPTPGRIMALLLNDPMATLNQLAELTGVSRSAIQKQITNLVSNNYISRPEGKKRGWIVHAKNTEFFGKGFKR